MNDRVLHLVRFVSYLYHLKVIGWIAYGNAMMEISKRYGSR